MSNRKLAHSVATSVQGKSDFYGDVSRRAFWCFPSFVCVVPSLTLKVMCRFEVGICGEVE